MPAILNDGGAFRVQFRSFAVWLYGLHTMIGRAPRLEYDEVPERIVEIPAPGEGAATADIMREISR